MKINGSWPTIKRIFLPILILCTTGAAWALGWLWGLSKSDWAAWVQAVGSVGAIVVALWVVQLQHTRERATKSENDRQVRRRQLSALKWLFMTVAQAHEKCAKRIDGRHVNWRLEADLLTEACKPLTSYPLTEIPEASLLVRACELSSTVLLSATVVNSLGQPRSKEVQEKAAAMLRKTSLDAMTGVTETTSFLATCSSLRELQNDWKGFDDRKENRAMTLSIMEQLQINKGG